MAEIAAASLWWSPHFKSMHKMLSVDSFSFEKLHVSNIQQNRGH